MVSYIIYPYPCFITHLSHNALKMPFGFCLLPMSYNLMLSSVLQGSAQTCSQPWICNDVSPMLIIPVCDQRRGFFSKQFKKWLDAKPRKHGWHPDCVFNNFKRKKHNSREEHIFAHSHINKLQITHGKLTPTAFIL